MKLFVRLTLFSGLAVSTAQAAAPQDGTLDTTFGSDGKTRIALNRGGMNMDMGTAVVAGTDFSYVIGVATTGPTGEVSTITRLRENGTVDTTFGNQGTLYFGMLDGIYDSYAVSAAVLQSDGKLLVAGKVTAGLYNSMLVCRIKADGALDEGFGTDHGCQRVDFFDANMKPMASYANDIALQADQKILVIGSGIAIDNNKYPTAARLNTNGLLDHSFAANGTFVIFYQDTEGRKIIADKQGRIYLVGEKNHAGNCADFSADPFANKIYVQKLLANGQFDTNFNSGSLTFDFDYGYDAINNKVVNCAISEEYVMGVAIADDNSLLIGARAEVSADGNYLATITKLRPDGTFDPVFGNPAGSQIQAGQRAITVEACEYCFPSVFTSFLRLPDGHMLVAGQTTPPDSLTDAIAIRVNATGGVDAGFGSGALGEPGRELIDYALPPNGSHESVKGIALQNGKPVFVGWTRPKDSGDLDITAFRLNDDRIFWHQFE